MPDCRASSSSRTSTRCHSWPPSSSTSTVSSRTWSPGPWKASRCGSSSTPKASTPRKCNSHSTETLNDPGPRVAPRGPEHTTTSPIRENRRPRQHSKRTALPVVDLVERARHEKQDKGGAHMEALIEAEGLTKAFGKVRALNGLSLTVPTGQAVAILGPNGAGKTTFIRMVATLLRPDSGTLRVGGCDVVKEPMAVRRMIGLAGQSAAVEEMMTGRENLTMVARLYGQGKKEAAASAKRILEQMDLEDAADRRVKTYSGGMRRRLDLGASLAGAPQLLLLDEPTTGLDPGSRNEVWDAVREMSWGGTDILLTTQYLDEADHLAAHIVIIDGGRVIAQGTPDELKSRVGADIIELHASDVPTMQRA